MYTKEMIKEFFGYDLDKQEDINKLKKFKILKISYSNNKDREEILKIIKEVK